MILEQQSPIASTSGGGGDGLASKQCDEEFESPRPKRCRKMSAGGGLLATSSGSDQQMELSLTGGGGGSGASGPKLKSKTDERYKFRDECTTFLMTVNLLVNLCKLHLNHTDEERTDAAPAAAGGGGGNHEPSEQPTAKEEAGDDPTSANYAKSDEKERDSQPLATQSERSGDGDSGEKSKNEDDNKIE